MTCRKLKTSVSWEGKGLHSGEACKVVVVPSEKFLSVSLNGCEPIEIAKLPFEGNSRGTDLIFQDGGRVRTVEHLLSAIGGLGLWQVEVSAFGPEIPAVDGCAETFARALFDASEIAEGFAEEIGSLPVYSPVSFENEKGACVIALPSENFRITYIIQYQNPLIGTQIFDYAEGSGDFFVSEISRARTFALERDIKLLRENGMALGGSLDNAILVCDDEIKTAGGLRYKDEFARHKVLDLIGDLTLVGRPLKAHVVAIRAGHAPHLALVEKLRRLQNA